MGRIKFRKRKIFLAKKSQAVMEFMLISSSHYGTVNKENDTKSNNGEGNNPDDNLNKTDTIKTRKK